MLIIIPNIYQGNLWGSWNNWKKPIPLTKPKYSIQNFSFFIVPTHNHLEYKLEKDDHFYCIKDYNKIGNEIENNFIYVDNGYYKNGVFDYQINFDFIQIWKNGELFFKGDCCNEYPHGFCYEYLGDINFQGNYCNGLKHGKGTITYYFENESKNVYYKNGFIVNNFF